MHRRPAQPPPVGVNPSRVDVFMGYSYFGAHGQLKPAGINYSSIDLGAIGSGAYYFNKYVGGEVIFVASIRTARTTVFYSDSAGPIFRAPMQNFTLFAQAWLAARSWADRTIPATPSYHKPYTWGPTLTAGGGMDYDLPFFDNRFSLRLFQADYRYIHANYRPCGQSSDRLASGRPREPERRRTEHRHRDALRPHHSSSAGHLCLLGFARRRSTLATRSR